jgi:tRNA nucleotidyltransferase (CCA-adding enzyme)
LKPEDTPFLHLALLAYRLGDEDLEGLVVRLKMKRDDADDLRLLRGLQDTLARLGKARRPSAAYRLLELYPARVLAVAWVAADRKRLRDRLLRYQTEWRLVETEITGAVLKAMGLRPGPLFGRLLRTLRNARLDGRVRTREEEVALLEKLLEEEGDKETR